MSQNLENDTMRKVPRIMIADSGSWRVFFFFVFFIFTSAPHNTSYIPLSALLDHHRGKNNLSFNYASILAVSLMVYIFYTAWVSLEQKKKIDIQRIFIEHECIFCW